MFEVGTMEFLGFCRKQIGGIEMGSRFVCMLAELIV